jgi:hypothetical protein
MMNYVASTAINFEGSRFYVRPGDILSYNPQHGGGSLAIFRNGKLVKVLRVESLAIEAFLKSRFISEVKAPPKPPPAPAGAITIDTLADGYARTLKAPGPAPDLYGLLGPPGREVNDLGLTPAAQADLDSLCRQADEAIDAGIPQATGPLAGFDPEGTPLTNAHLTGFKRLLPDYDASPPTLGIEVPKREKRRRKPSPAGEIDYAVHPPPPPPSQVPGPEDSPPEPEQNRISEP